LPQVRRGAKDGAATGGGDMSDRTALILAGIIVAAIAADLAFGWGGVLFVLRRLFGLVDWLMFWR
jgi:hypothetical protein